MSTSLPDHPDLGQLRRQAKELCEAVRRGDPLALGRAQRQLPGREGPVSLATAQLVVAREHGFASWPQLKAAVDAARASGPGQLSGFVTASIDGPPDVAARLLAAEPGLGRSDIYVAAMLGDVEQVDELVRANPEIALTVDEERGWPPLLYVCYSHWHQIDPGRAPGTAGVAKLLLDAGASPNTHNGQAPNRGLYRSALHGAVTRNNPALTRLLLEEGAQPDDRVSLTAAVSIPGHECLRLLLDHGASLERTWALETAVSEGDAEAVGLLLDAAGWRATPEAVAALADGVMADAAENGPVAVIETLLALGAVPDGARGTEGENGQATPLQRAVRAGRTAVASLLIERGAEDNLSPVDHFIGACARFDRDAAERLLAAHPDLWDHFDDNDRAAIVDAARGPSEAPVELMLSLGFSHDASNENGETALHTSAHEGRATTVRLLLAHGAEVDARDSVFDSTPLAFATVGSGEHPNRDSDWLGTVRALLDAGASREDVWLSGPKAPSPEVAELLRAYGVVPESPPAEEAPRAAEGLTAADLERLPDLGTVFDVAAHLREAYEAADMDLFASLLHPEVHWGAGPWGCTDRDQVLNWYGQLRDTGFRGRVTTMELRGDAIIAGVSFGRPAEGARGGSLEQTYQVLRVDNGAIVQITGYTDLAMARAGARGGGGGV